MKATITALALLGSTAAERLLLASYGTDSTLGSVTTLELYPSTGSKCNRKLEVIHNSQECGPLPTWLDTSLGQNKVICLDESGNANITTFNLQPDGSLKKISSSPALGGAVSSATYNNGSAIALAHYGPPAISSYSVHGNSQLQSLQNITFADPEKIHQAVLDPTGQYMIFPSLGADRVHVYAINPTTGQLAQRESLVSPTGYGPRHAAFWTSKKSDSTFLFVVHELSNKIISYKATYLANHAGIKFTPVDEVSTYGNYTLPNKKLSASEISVSPDNAFVLAGNRNGTIFTVDNPDPKNSTKVPSDSIVTYKPSADGKLKFVQLAKSGGYFPRHFQLSKDGSMIAVANQRSNNVAIYARDVKTGIIKDDKPVAGAAGLGPGDLM
ncbi:hypothetical protein COCCADRAFT_96811 [Bipolaris zeicola 26-R-13]|uniref:3-carboxymuconate cyclase n=1 Tax=Cochliobolus carbonum (strain 26-R-13) TaxID=930089 RepID=W6Y6X5_COCC2|nr:uncharacterized protein COCCADRAFT_96811 [Bipolaris zeicola 26-R-13]EUC33170.1 hypothetical protein COCCADRAFT_96811 [Bipolaris zeicola 26-R-13]